MIQQEEQDQKVEINSRIGRIIEVHPDLNRVKIDFENNPLGQPIWGSIGRAFTISDIELAIDNQLDCRIEFFVGDFNLPILTDIYTSLLCEELLVLRAKKMRIEGEESITISSGEAKVLLTAKNGSIKSKAKNISTSAEKLQKIQAAKITLN
ncbi:hypothetical protein [Vibrio campbellii]|uniref:Gp5/Type VI secretion system Vgr protein OB-fold domain-containing protein n=1 Tax=Vibrio campbellii TaxID=680 RepID=A0ABY5I8N1_9VIBR|nr:hypothetical protein [Vibrio campbellii]UTZ21903.1 hypothetical protein HB760_08240 [Vibrio campbellii]UTZ30685.1 hypothetical protein HB762_04355 [Vibrio campbellii]UTZ41437.1 hypothetical protein HB764_08525 [Vibrio campbellii]